MNKKQAIAYAQVTLDYMLSLKYNGPLNADTFAIEMKQAFKEYPSSIILSTAEAQSYARRKLQEAKNGSDVKC